MNDEVSDLAVIEAALKAATPGPWAVKEINLGAIGTQDDVLWPWVFATNPMPIPAAHGATTGPLIADLSRRHEEDPEDGIDYAHGGIASIETTDGNYPERDAADANLIANAPSWLAELVERVKVAEAEADRLRLSVDYMPEGVEIVMAKIHNYRQQVVELQDLLAEQRKRAEAAEAAEAAIERVRAVADRLKAGGFTSVYESAQELGEMIADALDGDA